MHVSVSWHSPLLPWDHSPASPAPPPGHPPTQGKHVDRLMTVCYLPANLLTLGVIIWARLLARPKLRVVGGMLGFALAMLLVALVRGERAGGSGEASYGAALLARRALL